MTIYSTAHAYDINVKMARRMYPDGKVSFRDPKPPDPTKLDEGRLRGCDYCGSMHPTDVVDALKNGAWVIMPDMKYAWPHKFYIKDVPNPYAGMLQSLSKANYQVAPDWIQTDDGWMEPPYPAPDTRYEKFYTVHLQDATPEEKKIIELHVGIKFTFKDGYVEWRFAGVDNIRDE